MNPLFVVIPISTNDFDLIRKVGTGRVLVDLFECSTEVSEEHLELFTALTDSRVLVVVLSDVVVGTTIGLE